MMVPPRAWKLFENDERPAELERLDAPDLVLRGTSIGVCDPFTGMHSGPLARSVPPGRHRVDLLLRRDDRDCRVALARVRLGTAAPVRWEMATWAEQDVRTLRPEQSFGYGVDHGTGCFADPEAIAAFVGDAITDFMSDGVADRGNTWAVGAWAHGGGNLVAFSSGYGDGIYTSWWGLDEHDEPVALVTDFGVLEALDWPEAPDDASFRRQYAEHTLARLIECIENGASNPDGPTHGDAYDIARELQAVASDAVGLLPPLLDAIERWGHGEDALDHLSMPLWSLMGEDAAQRELAERLHRWSPELRLDVLSSARGSVRIDTLAPELTHALLLLCREQPELLSPALDLATQCRSSPAPFVQMAASVVRSHDAHALHCAPLLRSALRLLGNAPRVPPETHEALLTIVVQARDDGLKRLGGSLLAKSAPERLARALADADLRTRFAAAMALRRHDPSRDRLNEVGRGLVRAPSLSVHERIEATTLLTDESERADVYTELALTGHDVGVIQLAHLDDDAFVGPRLERIAREAPSDVANTASRLLAQRRRA